VIVGAGCRIGKESVLMAGVILADRVRVGRCVRIHSGAVIGSDGFGFARDGGEWVRVPQLGGVVIGDHADIGANSAVDRGALEDTVIETQVKLDNLVQIGHNCRIGARTVIAGQAGVAGSTTIGRDCMIGGACAIGGHISIADGVVITGGSNVSNSIGQAGMFSSTTTPVESNRAWRRNAVRFTQLDDMARRLRALESRLDEKEG
jgi:UDP-3-O-[3-hydroxymyristoyl] glucosamine N-acyltransferase